MKRKKYLDSFALKNLSFGWKIPFEIVSSLVPLEDNIFDNFNFFTVFEFTRHITEMIHLLHNNDKSSDGNLKMTMMTTTLTLTFGINNFLSF